MSWNISVVYAAYNEEANLRETLDRSIAAMRAIRERHGGEFELLVINDCSRDNTGKMLDETGAVYPELRVLHNPRNLGQGGTLVRAFGEAKFDWVIHNAMDYPFDLNDLERMLPLTADADIVVAARDGWAGYSRYRKVLSHGNRFLLRTLFGLSLNDYNFTQLYRREVLARSRFQSTSTGFLTPSLLIEANDNGYRIREVEVAYHPRLQGVATAGNPKVVLKSLGNMLKFWWRRRTTREPAIMGVPHDI